jgi:hypothetical protein
MKRSLWLTALALLVLAGTAMADNQQWMHVRVQESGGEKVSINLPLSLVESMLTGIETDEIQHGRVVIDKLEFNRDLIREIITAARENQNMDFVTIKENDQEIRIASKDEDLLVTLDEGKRGKAGAEIRVPLKVVEALLGGAVEDELDFAAALRVLGEGKGSQLVTMRDGDESVRVWVDADAESDKHDGDSDRDRR